MGAQDEVPKACITLVTKVYILIDAISVERQTLLARYQRDIAEYSTINWTNEVPIFIVIK